MLSVCVCVRVCDCHDESGEEEEEIERKTLWPLWNRINSWQTAEHSESFYPIALDQGVVEGGDRVYSAV